MSKITIFQHLVQNASRIIRKKGNADVEFDALMLSFFPLFFNFNSVLFLVEKYFFGNIYIKTPISIYLIGAALIAIFLYYHTKDTRKEVKAYYAKLDIRSKNIYLFVFVLYYVSSIASMFLIRHLIEQGKI